MMKILSLDSSSPVASVAFVTLGMGEPVVGFRSNTPHVRSDSSALFAGLREASDACGRPDRICVGLGPGSYNGLRAGVAAARGFATALGIPLHALPSPLAIAGSARNFWAVGDARGGRYWLARIGERRFVREPELLSPAETPGHLASFPDLPVLGSTRLEGIPGIVIATPCAVQLAILSENTERWDGMTPEPLYLKPPHITAPRPPAPSR